MLDLSNIESADSFDRGSNEIQESIYKVCVSDLQLGESRSGKPMVTAEFVISEGPAKGKRFKNWYVLNNEKGTAVLKHFLEAAMGAPVASFGQETVAHYIGKELLMGIGLEDSGQYMNARPVCVAALSEEDKIVEKFGKALPAFKKSLAKKATPKAPELTF